MYILLLLEKKALVEKVKLLITLFLNVFYFNYFGYICKILINQK